MDLMKKKSENSVNDKYKLSKESAEEILDSYLDYFDLTLVELLEENEENDGIDKAIKTSYNRLVKDIRKEKVEIEVSEETCTLTQHVGKHEKRKSLVYRELSGAAKVAMKNSKSDDLYGKIYSLVGSLTGLGKEGITQLTGRDLSTAESIGMLLMQI